MNNMIKLNKEYKTSLGLAALVITITHFYFWFSSDSRGEIISVFVFTTVSFIFIVIYNLFYFIRIFRLEFRLLLPGFLCILTPILLWRNNDISITQYIINGLINLIIGSYFYIRLIIKK
jgi:hypothetical protein